MKRLIGTTLISIVCLSGTGLAYAQKVELPSDISDWIHYRISDTGRVIEEMYAPKEVVQAAKQSPILPLWIKNSAN
ncbi:MAG: hypothetical protein LUC43_07335 [Burkholderiales bacterium]|nr:hypothetical protein [Burkholderiales bacterium]